MVIPEDQYRAACRIASRVYDAEMRRVDGIKELAEQFKLNRGSAGDYINDYKCLVEGRIFYRKMSAAAMRYFISEIERQRGASALVSAVTSLNAHIEYVEQHYDVTSHSLREVVDDFCRRMETETSAHDVGVALSEGVERTLTENNAAELANRLKHAPRKPRAVTVQTTAYLRNPDVVAAVLWRANGICEKCGQPAPFISAATNLPYLEIHHIERLADGGEDTMENTLALCPNCHREAHFG